MVRKRATTAAEIGFWAVFVWALFMVIIPRNKGSVKTVSRDFLVRNLGGFK
jgi:hypothetical protein